MEYLLSKGQYEFLRKECHTSNSLVPAIRNIELTKAEVKELENKNYIKKGRMTEALFTTMQTICKPLTIQRQRLINLDINIEQCLYYRQDNSIVCVSESNDGVKIESPYNNEDDLEAISQYFGGSIMKGMALNLSLPLLEAAVLAGVWDCVRKNNLSKIYEDDLVDWVRKDELVSFIQEIASSQSLCFFIKAYNNLKPDRSTILEQLTLLEKKGLIEGSERIVLTDETFEVAMRFLHIKTMLQLTTALDNGVTYGSEMIILQDGVTDVLLMEISAENVTFLSMASLEVIALLDAYYKDPNNFLGDLYEDERVEVPSVESNDTSKIESSGAKFCEECGAKRSKDGKFCSECGTQFK